jgi:hypothetical protein
VLASKYSRPEFWLWEVEGSLGAMTPGPLDPARELLGEMLLEMNEPAQALERFEATLMEEPGCFHALY